MRGASTIRDLTVRGALCAGAVTLLLSACGDDSADEAETFCEEGAPAFDALLGWMADAALSREDLGSVAEAMEAVDPPGEASDDWDSVLTAIEALRDSDPGDPAAVAEAERGVLELSDELSRLEEYVRDSC